MLVNKFGFHRVVVAAAIFMVVLLAVWSVREYKVAGDVGQAVVGVLACLVIVALTASLVYVNRNLMIIRHMLQDRKRKTGNGGNGTG